MNTVKRAIIMAAGIGKRMRPVSLETPKPLIKVNGERMIDSVLEALHKNGIYEIYIVIGYLKDQFYEWVKGKEGVSIIENPLYDQCNNISSLYAAREHLEDVIILDGDQIIYNPEILKPEFEKSGYNGVWTEAETDEWLMTVENNRVVSCSRTGGKKGWQLFSISRWSKHDGKKLLKYLKFEFEQNKNTQIYWDDIAMFCHFKEFNLGVIPMNKNDIIEIDSFDELVELDHSYLNYGGI